MSTILSLALFYCPALRCWSVLPGMAASASTPAAMLRVSIPVSGYAAGMLQTDHDAKVKLSLPPHVAEVLTGWAVFELHQKHGGSAGGSGGGASRQRAAAGVRGRAGHRLSPVSERERRQSEPNSHATTIVTG